MPLVRLLPPLALLFALAAPAQAAGPAALFYERTLMSAAGARCSLFAPPVAAALQAGAAQARGAALRSGAPASSLSETERRARAKAASVDCADPDLKLAATRVRDGFSGYSKLPRMQMQGWAADRSTRMGWRLSQTQTVGGVRATLGLDRGRPTVAAAFTGAQPSVVRLRIRDTARGPHPDLRGSSLRERAPNPAQSRAIHAASREAAPTALMPGGTQGGQLWRLPQSAVPALAALDPREAVVVEFVFPSRSGDAVKPVWFEVGDFAAGVAFLQAGA